ncbi:uncharacterized protein LOC129962417 isoform X1 [Argiope bruennichi]|uniref:uncharacterized protein LOC129962417 isoform X1 n=1 Tax=Argiope bruennichi TaxID=94029 RepID=UPI00249531F1|nr:uncharacterized protein LOC129962417 isoform X1 [Argiope bruennichi]
MTLQNNNDAKGSRTKQTTLSPTLVRCLCVTISFVTTGFALLAFGLTCYFLRVYDESSAPFPHLLTVIAFGVSGGLLGLGLVLLLCVCKRRKRLTKEALLDELPEVCSEDAAQYRKKMSTPGEGALESHGVPCGEDMAEKELPPPPSEPLADSSEDAFEMTQKSADVSHWIEQQKSTPPATLETFTLETTDVATRQMSDGESSEGEMTAL